MFEECKDCHLYLYEFAYGSTRELYGFVEIGSSYTETNEEYAARVLEVRQARKEARQIWNNPECRPFLNAIRDDIEDDSPKLIFADWLCDHDMCEMQEKALRESCRVIASSSLLTDI